MNKLFAIMIACALLAGCAESSGVRMSANEVFIHTSAAPICGSTGAAKVAEKQAAVETLRAGFDRYIIVGAASANNVQTLQMPGQYNTTGTYGMGGFNATTTYSPGPMMMAGSHDQSFGVRMFKDGDPGASQALPARATLGDKWQEIVKSGAVRTCT